jgi:uncharacterized protein involved in exopolysaccharide biosynthesis
MTFAFCLSLLTSAAQQSPPQTPIIVKIVETPRDPTGLASVLLGALGLTGVILLLALVLGLLAGGILYFARSRIRR